MCILQYLCLAIVLDSGKLKFPFGESINGEFSCPFCANFTSQEGSSFQIHLFEEMNYRT